MNKTEILIGVIVLICSVTFSGCQNTQTDMNNDENDADIISYSIITTWTDSEYHEESGFYHNISDNAIYNSHYIINGIVENTGSKLIEQLFIKTIFYDANNREVYVTDKTNGLIKNLLAGSTKNFLITVDFYDSEYYANFDHVVLKSRYFNYSKYLSTHHSFC